MLKKLGLSRSGYHNWINRKVSSQEIRIKEVKNKIKEIWNYSKQIYGAPNIAPFKSPPPKLSITPIAHAPIYDINAIGANEN